MVTLLIASLVIFIPAWLIASWLFPKEGLKAALFYLTLVLIEVTVIELGLGIIGQINSLSLLVVSLALNLILLGIMIFVSRRRKLTLFNYNNELKQQENTILRLNRLGIIIIFSLIVILSFPFYGLFFDILKQIILVHPLTWDVVSYHLPNVMDYINSGSLWTLQGAYNQYPGGNELIQIWSFLPLKLDTLLGINTAIFSLGFLLVSTLILGEIFLNKSPFISGIWTILLWIICLSIPNFQFIIFDFGRNDITLAFWELVAFWALLQAVKQGNHRNLWLVYTGISLGMGIGVKPNGLYYLLGFIVLILTPLFTASNRSKIYLSKLLDILLKIILPALIIGGFWYLRNLLKMGYLFDPKLIKFGTKFSIFNNLLNPQFYQGNLALFIFLIIFIIIVASALLSFIYTRQIPLTFKLLTGFSIIAFIALIMTPSSAGYGAGEQFIFRVELRYGIALIPTTAILLLFLINTTIFLLITRFPDQLFLINKIKLKMQEESKAISSFLLLGIFNLFGAAIILLQLFSYQPPSGLPGFNNILFAANNPPSIVYKWIQKNLAHQVIYSIGLRPYGVYGFPHTNQVIYNLDSADWNYSEGKEIINKFHPQFIFISRDPFSGKFPEDIKLLLAQSTVFKLIYKDDLAFGFQITNLQKIQPQK